MSSNTSSVLTPEERSILFLACTNQAPPCRWLVAEFSGGNDSGGFDHVYLSADNHWNQPHEWWVGDGEVYEFPLEPNPMTTELLERVMLDQIGGFDGPPDLMGKVTVDAKERGITVTWMTQEWREMDGGEY